MSVSVSIIVANYNNSKYITDCLNSIARQSFFDWEAIVVDDGSIDNSVEIIEKIAQEEPRFTIVKLANNMGLSAARNTGIRLARGKYVAFLDSDDCLEANALEKMYYTAEKHGADAVKAQRYKVQDSFKIDEAPNILINSFNEQVIYNPTKYITSWFKDPMFVWLYLYKRSVIKNHYFMVNMRPCEDVNFTIKILTCITKLVIVDFVSVFYRLSENSIMQNYKVTESTIASKVANCNDINEFFKRGNDCSEVYKNIAKSLVYDLLLMDVFYIPLMQQIDLLDYSCNIMSSLCKQYDIKSFYNLRIRLALTAYCHKKYGLSRFLLDKKYFQKYTRKKGEKNENTNNK